MMNWLQTSGGNDARTETYVMRLDRHVAALLNEQEEPGGQAPLVALAYWGVDNVIESSSLATRLRKALDELAALPHGTLGKLLARSVPPLDRDLPATASCVLDWLIEYLYLDEESSLLQGDQG